MRVAADDGSNACGCWAQIEVMEGVHYVEEPTLQLNNLSRWQLGARTIEIDVAADSGDGSNGSQGLQYLDIAHIARMQDVADAVKRIERLGTEETMGIRDNADQHTCFRLNASA